jgi:hypothetical protein
MNDPDNINSWVEITDAYTAFVTFDLLRDRSLSLDIINDNISNTIKSHTINLNVQNIMCRIWVNPNPVFNIVYTRRTT